MLSDVQLQTSAVILQGLMICICLHFLASVEVLKKVISDDVLITDTDDTYVIINYTEDRARTTNDANEQGSDERKLANTSKRMADSICVRQQQTLFDMVISKNPKIVDAPPKKQRSLRGTLAVCWLSWSSISIIQ